MKFYPETNELKGVCVTEDGTIPMGAGNSKSLIQNIRDQMDKKIKDRQCIGILGYNDSYTVKLESVAFVYDNPHIIDDKLYVDVKVLNTPNGKIMKKLISDLARNNHRLYRFVLTGIGIYKEDDIVDYSLISVNFVPR